MSFYAVSDFPDLPGYGNGQDDGQVLTAIAERIRELGGGVLRIPGSPLLDTTFELYQGVCVELSGALCGVFRIRDAEVGVRVVGERASDLSVGGYIKHFRVEGHSGATGIERVGTRNHLLDDYIVDDCGVGETITSRDDGDPDRNVVRFASAFNHTRKGLFRKCGVGQQIHKGSAYSNRNTIQATYQTCDVGVDLRGTGTNKMTIEGQGCRVVAQLSSSDGKNCRRNRLLMTNENHNQDVHLHIGEGSRETFVFGTYNPDKVIDEGVDTYFEREL